ncbi:MAG: histidinol-phosphate transaminase [Pseudomonadota bacterium]
MPIADRINAFAGAGLETLVPYKVEDATGLIKLDAMENPYSIPDTLREAWILALDEVEVNRYPDPHAVELKGRLRRSLGLGDGTGIVIGNGSDELIHLLCLAAGNGGVLCMEPTFSVYRLAAQACGLDYHGVPLTENFEISLNTALSAIERFKPAIVFVASPNNPTGNAYKIEDILALCDATSGIVVLDEAYWRFHGRSEVQMIESRENLLVLQTLSKIGLAGIRLGMMFGPQAWIDFFDKLRMPYNVGNLSQAAANFALEHESVFADQINHICVERERLTTRLQAFDNLRVWPSRTNFILFQSCQMAGPEVHRGLKEQGVLIKSLDGSNPRLQDCLRVTVGLPQENDKFLEGLSNLV